MTHGFPSLRLRHCGRTYPAVACSDPSIKTCTTTCRAPACGVLQALHDNFVNSCNIREASYQHQLYLVQYLTPFVANVKDHAQPGYAQLKPANTCPQKGLHLRFHLLLLPFGVPSARHETLGHVLDTLGNPIDGKGKLTHASRG